MIITWSDVNVIIWNSFFSFFLFYLLLLLLLLLRFLQSIWTRHFLVKIVVNSLVKGKTWNEIVVFTVIFLLNNFDLLVKLDSILKLKGSTKVIKKCIKRRRRRKKKNKKDKSNATSFSSPRLVWWCAMVTVTTMNVTIDDLIDGFNSHFDADHGPRVNCTAFLFVSFRFFSFPFILSHLKVLLDGQADAKVHFITWLFSAKLNHQTCL